MYVVEKKSMIEKIEAFIVYEELMRGIAVDYVVLTEKEYETLLKELKIATRDTHIVIDIGDYKDLSIVKHGHWLVR
jgi:hypothetical protein